MTVEMPTGPQRWSRLQGQRHCPHGTTSARTRRHRSGPHLRASAGFDSTLERERTSDEALSNSYKAFSFVNSKVTAEAGMRYLDILHFLRTASAHIGRPLKSMR